MNVGTWISLATVACTIIFNLVSLAVVAGGFRQKVADQDRRFEEIVKRVVKCETDMGLIPELKTQVAVLDAGVRGEVRALKEMSERDTRELRHDISGLRVAMDKVTDVIIGKRGQTSPI